MPAFSNRFAGRASVVTVGAFGAGRAVAAHILAEEGHITLYLFVAVLAKKSRSMASPIAA
jgi:hypothetical protein